MFFKDNPFYLLGVHTTDSGACIDQALQEKLNRAGGEKEKNRLLDAAYMLRKSVKRSGAEFFWLPGLEKERAFTLVDRAVRGDDFKEEDFSSLPPLSRVVLSLNGLFYGSRSVRLLLEEICDSYEAVRPEEGAALFNGDRRKAGLPVLRNFSHVEMWKRELPSHLTEAVKHLDTADYAALLAELGKTRSRSFPWGLLLLDFEEKSRKQREKLEKDLQHSLSLAEHSFSDGLRQAEKQVDSLAGLTKPLCLRNGYWPLEPSFLAVRNQVIAFWKEGKRKESRAMGDALFPFFQEWKPLKEQIEKDRQAMEEGRTPDILRGKSSSLPKKTPPAVAGGKEGAAERTYPLFLLFLVFFILLTVYYFFLK